jgi:hypothetical protein
MAEGFEPSTACLEGTTNIFADFYLYFDIGCSTVNKGQPIL